MAKPKKKTKEMEPPIGGLFLAYAYQNQAPYTTIDCLNVRPYDVAEMRGRIGTRPGLEKAFAANVGPGEVRCIGTVQWVSSNAVVSTLLVSAAGQTKYSTSSGTLTAVTASSGAAISATQLVLAVELSQKLYVADWDPDATISAAARVPKVFDPSTNTLAAMTASSGTLPTGCPVIARYRGRIVFAGARANPHVITACKINDPTNWDLAADVGDKTRAWQIGAGDAFTIGQPVTAFIPTNDQCAIIGCTNSLYVLRNDPVSGGSMNLLDADFGIVSHGAWCYGPGGVIVFLSHNGLAQVYGGCADHRVELLSRDRLPKKLLNLGQGKHIVTMAFDIYANGVLIFVSPIIDAYTTGTVTIVDGVVTLSGGTWPSGAADKRLVVNGSSYDVATRDSDTQITLEDTTVDVGAGAAYALVSATTAAEHYFFDWKNKGFWPAQYNWKDETVCCYAWRNYSASGTYTTEYEQHILGFPSGTAHPTSEAHELTANESTVLLGNRDGYLRWHRTTAADDDGNAISSYLVYGPLGFGRSIYDCTIDAVHLTRGGDSGDILCTLMSGPSPEQALKAPTRSFDYNTTADYVSSWWYPRIGGSDFYAKLQDIDGDPWIIERLSFIICERGQSRGG